MKDNTIVKERLRNLALQGAVQRYGTDIPKEVTERINHELKVLGSRQVVKERYAIHEIIQWAKDNDLIFFPRGGKSNGSLVLYCLEITNYDPMELRLKFEDWCTSEEKPLFIALDLDAVSSSRLASHILQNYSNVFRGYEHYPPLDKFSNIRIPPKWINFSLVSTHNLNLIAVCLDLLKSEGGAPIDLNNISLDDRGVLDKFLDLEYESPIAWSDAMKERLKLMDPYSFMDIAKARMDDKYRTNLLQEMYVTYQIYLDAYFYTHYPETYRKAEELLKQRKAVKKIKFEYEVVLQTF